MGKTFQLDTPLIDGGVRSVNFFNGRLLTANDLRREQAARRAGDRWIGQAVGDGVAFGLQVKKHADSTAQDPLVTVEAGLAVNREGQALRLDAQATIALARKSKLAAVDEACFAQCGNLQTGTYIAGPGVYLLTIAPANPKEGKALTSGFDPYGGRCNTDAIVETVQFRLIALESEFEDLDFTNEDRLRNLIAYRCFGVDDLRSFRADPFGADSAEYGVLDSLAKDVVTSCDVPLAIVYWTLTGGIRFIDMWSVRRTVTKRTASDWPWLADERRQAEGRAMFLQFQDHVEGVLPAGSTTPAWTLKDRFNSLPPVGVIAVPGERKQAEALVGKLFEGLTVRGPAFIEGARFEPLVRSSFAFPALDLSRGELIWLYWVRDNWEAIDYQTIKPRPRAQLIFASGHLPYQADARFDLSKWDYANLALDR